MSALTNAKLFAGNANLPLAKSVAKSLGMKLGNIDVDKFSDKEIRIEIDEAIRTKEVFIIQPTCPPASNLMELLLLIENVNIRFGIPAWNL